MGLFTWFERLLNGDVHYTTLGEGNYLWNDLGEKIATSKTNPILLPVIQLIADYYSSAKFYEVINGVETEDTPLIRLMKKPNPLQAGDDFSKQEIWYKYSCGVNYMYPIMPIYGKVDKIDQVKYLYNLKPDKVEFKKDFFSGILYTEDKVKQFNSQKIYYDRKNDDKSLRKEIEVGHLIPFYDTANGLDDNILTAPSRLDALKKPLSNIDRAHDAKNIVLQSNGKEMITNETVGNIAKTPLKKAERDDIDGKMNISSKVGGYGMGAGKKRTIITNSALKYTPMHIVLADLGLDESVIKDAQTIVNAFGVPPELFSLDGTSSTFENQEKAVIHFLQSKIQRELNDKCETFNNRYGTFLVAKLDHLPIMQSINKSKIATLRSFAFALEKLVTSGILTVAQAQGEYYKYVDKI